MLSSPCVESSVVSSSLLIGGSGSALPSSLKFGNVSSVLVDGCVTTGAELPGTMGSVADGVSLPSSDGVTIGL